MWTETFVVKSGLEFEIYGQMQTVMFGHLTAPKILCSLAERRRDGRVFLQLRIAGDTDKTCRDAVCRRLGSSRSNKHCSSGVAPTSTTSLADFSLELNVGPRRCALKTETTHRPVKQTKTGGTGRTLKATNSDASCHRPRVGPDNKHKASGMKRWTWLILSSRPRARAQLIKHRSSAKADGSDWSPYVFF